jgi:hypothetical protein
MASSDRLRDSLILRTTQSLRGSERAERLSGALAGLARELADARRQIATLTRENAALRKRLEAAGVRAGADLYRAGNRPQPRIGIGGGRGG